MNKNDFGTFGKTTSHKPPLDQYTHLYSLILTYTHLYSVDLVKILTYTHLYSLILTYTHLKPKNTLTLDPKL